MQSQTDPTGNRKPRGIFINTQKANCSIYESGVMVYQCLKLSERYSLDYMEIDPKGLSLRPYDFYFFNYHHATMSFVNTKALRQLPGVLMTMVLETLPNNPFPLCPAGDFDIYCALDPTMNIPDKRVYAFPRPLEVVEHITPYQDRDIPVIGSFGFPTVGKGFELVVDAVNKEFDRAIVRINMPSATYADNHCWKLFKQKYSVYLEDLCRKVAKPGIQVFVTEKFMDKHQLIEWCAQNTLNCFFYDRNQPGLSATTDQAIASERPLLVSANETFRHIHPYIEPYPYTSLKDAISGSTAGVLKMKEDWHPRKFTEKFETVLEDCNLLAKTGAAREQVVIHSQQKKDAILIVSHGKTQCGIYQYGIDISNSLGKSSVYDFVYVECSSPVELDEAIKKNHPKGIIYNYYHSTMPWLNSAITGRYNIAQYAIMHEVTQEEADNAIAEMFDGFMCPDPTLAENKEFIYKTPRLIPTYCNYQNIPDIPTIGSFGFGFHDKGFERLVDIAQKEFDRIRIRIHMPFNDIVDKDGKEYALKTAQRCRDILTNRNVDLQIDHSYFDKPQLLDFLAGNTVNAFFYDINKHRGISSVIDSALAVRRPIAITKCGMFRHVVNTRPSICIEDSDFKTIINNGIAPLVPYYNDWSEAAFIKRYEEILDNVLGKAEQKKERIEMKENVSGGSSRPAIIMESISSRPAAGAMLRASVQQESAASYVPNEFVSYVRDSVLNNITGLIQEAEKLIQAKSYLTARIILHEVLRHDSGNILSLIDLSVCDIMEGKSHDATTKLNMVLRLNPGNKTALANLDYIRNQKAIAPYKVSSVVPSRNDNFGGDLAGTATASLQTMSKTFEEVILVDFGSFNEPMISILDKTIKERKGNIRVITVPRQWVLNKLGDDSTFADVLARNIGIRRAKHDIIVSSNIDIIPGPRKYFDFTQFDPDIFYSSNKFMIERSMIADLRDRGCRWEDIQEYLFQTRNNYLRQGGFDGDPWSRVSGCGDFQIGHRKIWFHDQVRGFEETLIFKDHTDTNLHKKIIENGRYDVQSALFFYVFHQSHENIRNRGACKLNDNHASVHGFGQTTNPPDWGFVQENFQEYLI
jgi:hypothetical protein